MAEEPTLRGLLLALALGALNSMRQNKLAAALAVFVNGFSSIMTALNFVVTVHRLRAPGMT